jgi:hypothetical protein
VNPVFIKSSYTTTFNWGGTPGETIDIKVVMHAPKQPGSYGTTWIFGSKKNVLCKMTLAIIVK